MRTQIKRKRYTDFLRDNLDHSLELAVTDQLTGLHNRRYMTGQLDALVKRAARGGDPVAALLIDIDHFKKINDSFGHDVGDEVLREFAVRLASNVRAIDLPCRYGGEEFVDHHAGHHAGGRPAHRRADPPARRRLAVPGVARLRTAHRDHLHRAWPPPSGDGDNPEALLKRADEALYEAKAAGRNRAISRAA